MKLIINQIMIVLTLCFALVLFSCCTLEKILPGKYPHDNHIEEAAEAVIEVIIEDRIGLENGALSGKVDLTPTSKEPDKK